MLNKIVKRQELTEGIVRFDVAAPAIAKKAEPGQFVILRVHPKGERIPLTIADSDRTAGTIAIIFQMVGQTTRLLGELGEGDSILDLAGPLGQATPLAGYRQVTVVGGGLGAAIAFPQIKKLKELGSTVRVILGFRSRDLVIFEQEARTLADELVITTDDGSYGRHGFVTTVLAEQLTGKAKPDLVIASGPLPMMQAVSEVTRPDAIKTIVSMNPIMVDGTGMCGGCRLTVGGKTFFACVDGPDFDGHEVDFAEAIRRQQVYRRDLKSTGKHRCRLTGEERQHD